MMETRLATNIDRYPLRLQDIVVRISLLRSGRLDSNLLKCQSLMSNSCKPDDPKPLVTSQSLQKVSIQTALHHKFWKRK